MTPQERELLSAFLQQVTQAQAGQKDAEAEALIREAAARQPDAIYLLVQRALGLDYALQATQAQLAKLQSEVDILRPGAQSSFLNDPNAWGRAQPAPPPAGSPASAALAPLAPGTLSRTAVATPASAWGGAGILGTVATTAAGVVAGSFLYQGIQGLMGHPNQTANAGAHPSALTPEHAPVVLHNEEQDDAQDVDTDYADAAGGNFDVEDPA